MNECSNGAMSLSIRRIILYIYIYREDYNSTTVIIKFKMSSCTVL